MTINLHNKQDDGCHHAQRLKKISPHQRFDTCPASVGKYKEHKYQSGEYKWHADGVEQIKLQDQNDNVKTGGRRHHFEEDEKAGSCLMGKPAKTQSQIAIDAGKMQLIVERQKDVNHHRITKEKAENHLHISETHR